ncbi:MAG: helix-turn-helix transcriptional regulator [Fimbriimonadaceae bacterium]|nr:helix-turn-helix transcriptional regulator [Fimbriimonadaceae bacterium]
MDRLESARQIIEDRLDEQIPTGELAEAACLSPFHFIRMFHATFGISPAQYRSKRRFEKAQELLRQGHAVGWVATSVGLTSTASFSRDFRRRRGRSPKTIRNSGIEIATTDQQESL